MPQVPITRQPGASDLGHLLKRGASVQAGQNAAAFKSMLVPVLATWIVQVAVYSFFILRVGRSDWFNLGVVFAVFLAVNLVAALTLTWAKKQNSPLTMGGVLTLVTFVFGVTALSATRLPVSYVALGWCALIASVGLAVANSQLQRASHQRVGLLDFARSNEVRQYFPFPLPVIALDLSDLFNYDLVLIDTAGHQSSDYSAAILKLHLRGVDMMPWSRHLERTTGRVMAEDFEVSELVFRPDQIYYSIAKRTLDVASVLVLSPIAIPLACLIAIYVRLLDGGPSLFVQERRGRIGETFRMYKFRTMRHGTEAGATQSGDERILPGCRILRQLRLDELPQLFNILIGDMSWIGPRPVSLEIAKALELRIPQYINRQLVLPGLTGWAQVTLGYASTLDEEISKLSFDLYYIKHLSFDLDLLILFKTVRTVLWRAGAQ